jgi:hypothetical protein
MVWVPYETILFVYVQREWEDGPTKIRNKGKSIAIPREWENGHTKMKKWQGKYTIVQREQADGVAPCHCLVGQIGTLPRYSLLWVTSIYYHHSLLLCHLSAVMEAVPSDSKSMSWMSQPDVDVYWRQGWQRWRLTDLCKGDSGGVFDCAEPYWRWHRHLRMVLEGTQTLQNGTGGHLDSSESYWRGHRDCRMVLEVM